MHDFRVFFHKLPQIIVTSSKVSSSTKFRISKKLRVDKQRREKTIDDTNWLDILKHDAIDVEKYGDFDL
jgi:hypothetical protein